MNYNYELIAAIFSYNCNKNLFPLSICIQTLSSVKISHYTFHPLPHVSIIFISTFSKFHSSFNEFQKVENSSVSARVFCIPNITKSSNSYNCSIINQWGPTVSLKKGLSGSTYFEILQNKNTEKIFCLNQTNMFDIGSNKFSLI